MDVRERGSGWQQKIASWWRLLLTAALVANLILVGFDLSYLALRDRYLQSWPALVSLYDPIKGISPHPDTQRYLGAVDRLAALLAETDDPHAPAVEQQLLALQQQSALLILENPFAVSNKIGALTKLEQAVRQYTQADSAQQALQRLWTPDYLQQAGWQNVLAFFEREQRFLLAANFLPVLGDRGQRIAYFWQLDLGFVVLFGLDFLASTLWLARTVPDLSWSEAVLKRWYDGLLLLPKWRWSRALPALIRLNRARVIDLGGLLARLTREPLAQLAERTYTFLLVRLLNQTKTAVEREDFLRALLTPEGSPTHIQVGQPDKVDIILDRLLELVALKVLPEVQPGLQQLLRYNLQESLGDSGLYQGLQQIPGIESLPASAIDQVADYLTQVICEGLANSYSDLEGRALLDRFTSDFKHALRSKLLEPESQQRIQQALVDILEEIKLNYVQTIPQPDPEATLSEVDRLQSQTEDEPLA